MLASLRKAAVTSLHFAAARAAPSKAQTTRGEGASVTMRPNRAKMLALARMVNVLRAMFLTEGKKLLLPHGFWSVQAALVRPGA